MNDRTVYIVCTIVGLMLAAVGIYLNTTVLPSQP